MEKIVIEAISSDCGMFKPGDRIYIDGALVDKEKSSKICLMALQSFFPYIYALRKGVTGKEMSFDEKILVQCPDHCGSTVFELRKEDW